MGYTNKLKLLVMNRSRYFGDDAGIKRKAQKGVKQNQFGDDALKVLRGKQKQGFYRN